MKFKKILVPVFGAMLALGLAACTSEKGSGNEVEDKDNGSPEVHESKAVTYIEPTEVIEKVEEKETFAFVIGNAMCSACNFFKENALTQFEKEHGIKMNFVETFGIEKNSQAEKDFNELIEKHLKGQFEATPTTYFFVDGELANVIVGAMPYEDLVKNYEEYVSELEK